MLAPSTAGVKRSRTRRIARLASEQACRGTGTHIASGQSRSACAIDIADRTPNALVSYDAEHTTPRLPGRPPTMSSCALPAPSGSTERATATKKASASARRMRGMLNTVGLRRERGEKGRVARPDGSGEDEWGVGRNEWRGASLRGENGDRIPKG